MSLEQTPGIDVPDGVKPTAGGEMTNLYIYIAVGGLLLVASGGIVVVVAVLVRKKPSRKGMYTECGAIPLVTSFFLIQCHLITKG